MNAFVQLALIEKARRVFASDSGVMLSFPLLSPLSFTAAELAGVVAPSTAADYTAAADFSRIVNFLPCDIVASVSDLMLWDIYHDVLTRAEVAFGSGVTANEKSILYDGNRNDSEVLRSYRQYRDAWIVAREDYSEQKLAGELSEDPVVRQTWSEVDEPRLRAALDLATRDWETLGQRAVIEATLAAERSATLNSPEVRWAEWNAAFNPDIDMLTDVGGGQYAATGFSPSNFAKQKNWLQFNLSASEMKALVASAPEALKTVLDDDSGGNIKKVTFEYRSVRIVRPWFQPAVLTSGIWRSTNPDLILSDGLDPPNGVCPYYVSACVFVRNIAVTERRTGQVTTFNNVPFTLSPQRLTARKLWISETPRILGDLTRISLDPAGASASPVPGDNLRIAAAKFPRTQVRAATPPPSASVLNTRTLMAFRRLKSNSFVLMQPKGAHAAASRQRPRIVPPPKRSRAPSTSPPENPLPARREEISILAFICKRLPKAPDPAPGIRWS